MKTRSGGADPEAQTIVALVLRPPMHYKNTWERYVGDPMNTQSGFAMKTEDVLRVELEVFRQEHRDLDDAIAALQSQATADHITLQRLKKKKLALKDKIAVIEDLLTPDIIA